MPNLVNQLVTEELERELKDAEGMLIVSFAGLTVAESEALRGSLAEKGVRFMMVRNKLARQKLKEHGKEFDAEVVLRIGGAEADASSIIEVMMLASPQGTAVHFEARGPDAERAVAALKALVDSGFDEGAG